MKKFILVWMAILAINCSAIQISGSGEYTTLITNDSTPLPVYSTSFVSTATFTRHANTTAYTAGDVVGSASTINITFANIGPTTGGYFTITGAELEIDVNAIPSGMGTFRLHLYSSAPTAIADNAAYNLPTGDRAKYIGFFDMASVQDLGDTLFTNLENINLSRKLATGSTTIYGILQTLNAFTPSSACVKKITLHGVR